MSEHAEQVALIKWAQLMARQYPELDCIYANPNAGKRSIGAARYMIAEGMRAGVPDICLPVPRNGYGALYIELKYGKGKASEKQLEWIDRLNRHGNLAVVCTGWDAARLQILSYLEGK